MSIRCLNYFGNKGSKFSICAKNIMSEPTEACGDFEIISCNSKSIGTHKSYSIFWTNVEILTLLNQSESLVIKNERNGFEIDGNATIAGLGC